MKALPPPINDLCPAKPDRRGAERATPGHPFGRRAADQAFFKAAYPAAFVAQAAAASAPEIAATPPARRDSARPAAPVDLKGYRRRAPMGIVREQKS